MKKEEKNKTINYNDLMNLKENFEDIFEYFRDSHQELLNIIEDGNCFDDSKMDDFYSFLSEYESTLNLLKSDFYKLKSSNSNIRTCISQTKLLKKKRLSKIQSNMKTGSYNNDDELPF